MSSTKKVIRNLFFIIAILVLAAVVKPRDRVFAAGGGKQNIGTCDPNDANAVHDKYVQCLGVTANYCQDGGGGDSSSYDPRTGDCTFSCTTGAACSGNNPTGACTCGAGGVWICSPVVIDTSGKGINLTNVTDGVYFDIMGTGNRVKTAWTAKGSDNAWLALDRNSNGVIDNVSELFGSGSPQPKSDTPNGFAALAVYDEQTNGGNGDGFIDAHDAIYSKLRLWIDTNHDGYSDAGELHTLESLGVKKIDLLVQDKTRRDVNGNQFRYRARIWDKNDKLSGQWAWDVFLRTDAR